MKKYLCALPVFCLIFVLASGCSNEGAAQAEPVYPKQQEASKTADDAVVDGVNPRGVTKNGGDVDVDLTALSSTMIYAEVYNMAMSPEDYVGKTIKISGPYYAAYYEDTDLWYHFVIIEDALACCQQGMEFVWRGEHSFPDDYPNELTKISVTGVYMSYKELDLTYYYLEIDDINIVDNEW